MSETVMSDDELTDFLARQETGVLALSTGDTPYAIPVSYGYDRSRGIYLRLVSEPESEKRGVLEDGRPARLVVYSAIEGGYESAIVDGILVAVASDELTVADIEHYGDANRPLFEMWGADEPDLDIDLYILESTELSGRRVTVTRPMGD